MESVSLMTICFSAFVSVFVLLSILAVSMRLILMAFPEKDIDYDPGLIAGVAAVYKEVFPDSKIKKIEEER